MINPEQVVMLICVEIVLDQKHAESRLYNCVYLWNVHSKNCECWDFGFKHASVDLHSQSVILTHSDSNSVQCWSYLTELAKPKQMNTVEM